MKRNISVIDIVLVILFLMIIYFLLTRVFGHSASDLTISVSLFTFLAGLLYKLNREFGEFKIKTIQSFGNMKQDVKVIKEHLLRKR